MSENTPIFRNGYEILTERCFMTLYDFYPKPLKPSPLFFLSLPENLLPSFSDSLMAESTALDSQSEEALTMEEASTEEVSFDFSELPYEIFFDILTRLSMESLVTLKTVSKWWNNTLDNQKLAHQLISISLKDSSRNGILTMMYDKNSSSMSLRFSNNEEKPKVIHHAPFQSEDPYEFRFVNCCNGLICFTKGLDEIFICNPVTKEVISLPSTKGMEHGFKVAYGMGFSPATEEYKVIRMSIDLTVKPKVFTLGTSSSWRDIVSVPIHPFYGKSIYANGALHWQVDPLMLDDHYTEDNIMSFDIEKEEFYITKDPGLDNPMCVWRAMCERVELIQMGGCLGIVNKLLSQQIDIWILKDKEWIKKYVLKVQPPLDLKRSIWGASVAFRIIGLWQQGEIFMAWEKDNKRIYDPINWKGYSFFSYDPKTDRRRDIHTIIEPSPLTTITKVVCGYTMSLVSLKPYGYKK